MVMPMAKRRLCQKPRPVKVPTPKKNMPVLRAMTAIVRVTEIISFCRELSPCSTPLVRWAILPNSVAIPVAKTTALPEPLTTSVPAKTILGLSIRSPSKGWQVIGFDSASPVRGALFTARRLTAISRASAGTLSPSLKRIRSPGQTSPEGISLRILSLMTFTLKGMSFFSASTALSARYSWTKVNSALMKMTTTIAMPKESIPSP